MLFEVSIGGKGWAVMRSPDAITDSSGARCRSLIDIEQGVIWIDPDLLGTDLARVCCWAVAALASPALVPVLGLLD